jgi:H+/Cl- antiporter ClcA
LQLWSPGSVWVIKRAEGGLLTPGLTIGALLATTIGGLWNLAGPVVPLGAFAVVGGTAFLASSMTMPLTAIALIIEFTRVGHDFLIPISFAVSGSISFYHLCSLRNVEISRKPEDTKISGSPPPAGMEVQPVYCSGESLSQNYRTRPIQS